MTWSVEEWLTVAMCADAADCTYQDSKFVRKWGRFHHIATVVETDQPNKWRGCFHRAVLLRRGPDLVLAFRGTVNRYWRSEWSTNLHLTFGWFSGSPHRGFVNAVDRLWADVDTAIRSHPAGRHLYVTGHSKGAGMACVAAARLVRSGYDNVRLITFSEPPVYNLFAAPYVWQKLGQEGLNDYRRLIHTVGSVRISVCKALRLFHGVGRRLRRTDRRGGKVGLRSYETPLMNRSP